MGAVKAIGATGAVIKVTSVTVIGTTSSTVIEIASRISKAASGKVETVTKKSRGC